jgi:hypothetical protein
LCFGTDLTGNNNSAPNGAYCISWIPTDDGNGDFIEAAGTDAPIGLFVGESEDIWEGSTSDAWTGTVDMLATKFG